MVTMGGAIGLGWLWSSASEPIYKGKPLSFWLRDGGSWPELETHWGGATWPVWKGPKVDSNALPCLIKTLKLRDGALLSLNTRLYTGMPLAIQGRLSYPVPASVLRFRAVNLIGTLGPDARPAIPMLVQTFEHDPDRRVRMEAVLWLKVIDANNPEAIAVLAKAANDSDEEIRAAAAWKGNPQNYNPEAYKL